jgi:hypothetical protein
MGVGCIISQIIAQVRREAVEAEFILAGVTLLTATPFLWKGDERADEHAYKGKHETTSV